MNNITFIQRLRNKIKINKSNQIEIAKHVGVSGCTIIIKGNNNKLIIGENCRLRKVMIEIIGNNCSIEIGKKCVIGHGCYLSAKEENIHLIIGDECMFSRNVNILTSDGHPIFQNLQRINHAQNIIIGNHVWLADNATVLKGVTIGNHSVVGIHSVVTKAIPEHSIAIGIPAKVIKDKIDWKM